MFFCVTFLLRVNTNIGREVCVNYVSGVDHGTLDQGASLLTSNPLSSAMDSQFRMKGITCCFCSIFYVILFYVLLVISCNDIQRTNKVVDCRHRIRVNVVYSVTPIN